MIFNDISAKQNPKYYVEPTIELQNIVKEGAPKWFCTRIKLGLAQVFDGKLHYKPSAYKRMSLWSTERKGILVIEGTQVTFVPVIMGRLY